jgi:hypothetical protein
MIVRIYTGPDGQTHFEDLPLPAEESHNVALQAGHFAAQVRTTDFRLLSCLAGVRQWPKWGNKSRCHRGG